VENKIDFFLGKRFQGIFTAIVK